MKLAFLSLLLVLPGLPCLGAAAAPAPATRLSLEGFKPLFNGIDQTGWVWSKTVRHGTKGRFTVVDGGFGISQETFGQGGLLMTDKVYKNFELYLETDIQAGFNSGIFLRSSVSGYAYQIEMTGAASTTNLIVEGIKNISAPGARTTRFAELWKTTGWNSIRIRMTGDDPRIMLWLNDELLWDVQIPNAQLAGETDGRIGIQLHKTAGNSPAGAASGVGGWSNGTAVHFRNLYIKEL